MRLGPPEPPRPTTDMWLGEAVLRGRRHRSTSAPAYARPRSTALADILARSPTPNNIRATIRLADVGGHRRRGARILRDMEDARARTATHIPDWVVVARELWRRAQTASPATLTAYRGAALAVAERTASPLLPAIRHPLVSDYLRALRVAAGPPPLKRGAQPAQLSDVQEIVERASREVAQVVALAWLRAGRVADVLELRQGALWWEGATRLAMEQPPTKALLGLGLPRVIHLWPPAWARTVLNPLVGAGPPAGRGLDRPPLFRVTRQAVAKEIARIRPGLSAHSLRKGAIATLARGGTGIEDIMVLSGHRSREALTHYLGSVPAELTRSMRTCSALLANHRTPTRMNRHSEQPSGSEAGRAGHSGRAAGLR